jgi:hypothetical protein
MRRALSISLILLLWLPAFAALVPGTEDARLPFCCRRHGVHHCAMDAASAAAETASGPAVSAPSRCSHFPAALPATVSAAFVVYAAPANWTALVAGSYSPAARREAARAGRLRAQLDRGPPASPLA